jgi:stalled ribosome rescue protein Dom34
MTTKKLGIWMDHDHARLTEFTTDPMNTTTIFSKFTHAEKLASATKGENHMHSKEQHQQAEYYKELGERIRQYEEVVLFGPTNAKNELANSLKQNHRFETIKISVEPADKMTDNQVRAFVRTYFSRH